MRPRLEGEALAHEPITFKTELVFVSGLLIWAVWLVLEYFVFGTNSYVRLHNIADTSLPSLITMGKFGGVFSRWRPEWGTGADSASLPFNLDLDVIPFLLLPGWVANAVVMFAQRAIAGVFTYMLLRSEFRTPRFAALYAGMGYSLFTQATLHRGVTGFTYFDFLAIPSIPAIIFALSSIAKTEDLTTQLKWGLCTGVVLSLCGPLPISIVIAPFILAWFLIIRPMRTRFEWLALGVFFAVWISLAAIINAPQLIIAKESTRFSYDLEQIWGGLRSRVSGTIHNLLDNVIPGLLIGVAVLLSRFKERTLFRLGVVIATFALVRAFYFSVANALKNALPILMAVNLERVNLLLPILFFVGAGLALSAIAVWGSKRGGLAKHAFAVVATVVITVLIYQSAKVKRINMAAILRGENYKSYYLNDDLIRLANAKTQDPYARVATVAVGPNVLPYFPPGAVWTYGLESGDAYLNLQSSEFRDYWLKVIRPIAARDIAVRNWVALWGCQLNLFVPDKDNSEATSIKATDYFDVQPLSAIGVRYLISPIRLDDPSLRLLPSSVRDSQLTWARLGTRAKVKSLLDGSYPGTPLYIYENAAAYPRFFLTQVDDEQRAVDAKLKPSGEGVKVVRYENDKIEIEVSTPSNSRLIVMNRYSRYWRATVEGQEAPITRAFGAFQGLALTPGTHRVVLEYRRPYV